MAKPRDANLTEQQKKFCMHYVKTHNGSLSARNAGYSKNSCGELAHQLLKDPKIKQYIRLLKGTIDEELQIEAIDVIRKYAQIAFSDMTAFVYQENEYVPDTLPDGSPKLDKQGRPVYKPVLVTRVKPLEEIDGGLISEIKTHKDGITIKLEPKEKALEMLSRHFELFNDKAKRELEREYLEIEKRKLAILEKSSNTTSTEDIILTNNVKIQTLAELLLQPVPNRNIKSFEEGGA